MEENVVFTLRCYLSTANLIKEAKKTVKKNIYLVSSKEKNRIKSNKSNNSNTSNQIKSKK